MEYRPDSDGKVTVTLNFTAEGPLRAARGAASGTHAPAVISLTRAVATPSSTDETAVRDMWVLQYDMASPQGELRTKELVSEIYQEGEKVYVRAELEPMASSRIVVIANDPGSRHRLYAVRAERHELRGRFGYGHRHPPRRLRRAAHARRERGHDA